MTSPSETPVAVGVETGGAVPGLAAVQFGEVRDIPLNRLKASPKNARRVGHSAEVIEARAASIRHKGVLQPLVVEPEIKDAQKTGYYLVTAGEGRRQALRLLAKRKALAKGAAVRCVVDTTNDPAEVSMDENLSREPMHPADAYEAFRELSERRGWSAEEIGARFGLKADIVRQRLRLGAVAPALLDLYREAVLTLEQVTAFAVNPDAARQLQVFERLSPHQLTAHVIRRAMVEDKVISTDRRAQFVGVEAYEAAGGPVLRDLFTQAGGVCWLEDVALLETLAADKLAKVAEAVRAAEGWKWASPSLDFPHGHGCSRVWERLRERAPGESEAINALIAEDAELTEQWADIGPPPPEVAARFEAIAAQLEAYGDEYGYDPGERARAGVFVVLDAYGEARIERGFVRPEDEPVPEPDPEDEADAADHQAAGASDPDDADEEGEADGGRDAEASGGGEAEEPEGDPAAPLPDRVIAELTAHRSAALRDALAQNPDLAQVALVHALAAKVFGVYPAPTCLEIQWASRDLAQFGEGVEDSPAGRAIAERHRVWARQMPSEGPDLWAFIVGLDHDSRASLLAHCVGLSVYAVRNWERRPHALAHAETLASALDLDMRDYWKPTAVRYLDRVTKAHIVAAVSDGVSAQAAARLSGLKKPDMVAAAEPQLVEVGWLPPILRTARPQSQDAEGEGGGAQQGLEAPSEAEDALVLAGDDPHAPRQDDGATEPASLSAEDEEQAAASLAAAE
ncbi:chromosome partitioning protein ParB [Caulobacter flavus]|uniref:Chromosome partitioning protein ParB n=1 Tax=Caulobacter flavus TaxID=1679497 RepID=A0A2N5CWZ9_9CAUL|nr:ParB/RepB/Spo0J family partition protein [Caulobacter flavus]AYV47483.1 chromosome partitioning protein ParB [Caulobacter flavus]PLR18324.1 chromosome partitioning protein ParB [Caulobacter flavus]